MPSWRAPVQREQTRASRGRPLSRFGRCQTRRLRWGRRSPPVWTESRRGGRSLSPAGVATTPAGGALARLSKQQARCRDRFRHDPSGAPSTTGRCCIHALGSLSVSRRLALGATHFGYSDRHGPSERTGSSLSSSPKLARGPARFGTTAFLLATPPRGLSHWRPNVISRRRGANR